MWIDFGGRLYFNNVRYLRTKYGLSQRSLAALIGISPSKLRALESHKCRPCIEHTVSDRICQVFGLPLEDMAHAMQWPEEMDELFQPPD